MNILALNAGSASLKYKLFGLAASSDASQPEAPLVDGVEYHDGGSGIIKAAEQVIAKCDHFGIDGIGHRFVHGGSNFFAPTILTAQVLDTLRTLEPLDPLHNPTEIALVEAGMKALPNTPSVAIFDTAFHHTLPEVAWRYAIPREQADNLHLRRYGFHGTSHSYVSKELLKKADLPTKNSKVITCHLGSGSSICAVRDGSSIDTSMGLTPLEGLVMGTRSGDIDPGLLIYLLQAKKCTVEQINDLLNNKGGLAGISGSSSDVRSLEKSVAAGDKFADMALEIFAYRAAKYIGAYAVALEGVDAIAFTGGIGEHSPDMRTRISKRLKFLGVDLNQQANSHALGGESTDISKPASKVRSWVIPTNEELELARETAALLSKPS